MPQPVCRSRPIRSAIADECVVGKARTLGRLLRFLGAHGLEWKLKMLIGYAAVRIRLVRTVRRSIRLLVRCSNKGAKPLRRHNVINRIYCQPRCRYAADELFLDHPRMLA